MAEGRTGEGLPSPGPASRGGCTSGRHVAGTLLVLGVAIFLVTVAQGVATAIPAYSWRHSMLSDLGSRACVLRGGYRLCAPRAAWFDAGVVGSGALITTAGLLIAHEPPRLRVAAVLSMGLGLMLTGLVRSDVSHAVHMAGAVLALPVPAALVAVWTLTGRRATGPSRGSPLVPARPRRPAHGRQPVRAVLSVLALTLCLDHLPGDEHAPIPRGVAELVTAAALGALVLLDALELLRSRPDTSAGRGDRCR